MHHPRLVPSRSAALPKVRVPWTRAAAAVAAAALVGCGSSGHASSAMDAGSMGGGNHDAGHSVDGKTDGGRFTSERILFLVDTSSDMAVLDATPADAGVATLSLRAGAIEQVLANHKGATDVEFALTTLTSIPSVRTTTAGGAPGFTADAEQLDTLLPTLGSTGQSDYESALSLASTVIESDAKSLTTSARAATRYVVVFLGGSTPSPACNTGSEPCGGTSCVSGTTCWAGECSPDLMLCSVARSDWGSAFSPPIDASSFPDLTAGSSYNSPALIDQKVQGLVGLTSQGIGSVVLDAVLVFSTTASGNPLATPFHLDRTASGALLQGMAEAGGGTYVDLSTTPHLSF